MSMTDPIADMLTRIRNANMVKHQKVDIPSSNMKVSVASVLKQEGFINETTMAFGRTYLSNSNSTDNSILPVNRSDWNRKDGRS